MAFQEKLYLIYMYDDGQGSYKTECRLVINNETGMTDSGYVARINARGLDNPELMVYDNFIIVFSRGAQGR
jgi:hypothetical protein